MLTWINKQTLREWQDGIMEVISVNHKTIGNLNEALTHMHARLENFKNIVEIQNKRIELLEETLSNVTEISVHDSLLSGNAEES